MVKQLAIIFNLMLLASTSRAAGNISYGVVTGLQGHAFGVCDERTFTLKIGYKLPDNTEIITEEGSQISFMDSHDRSYHLSGAGHIEVTTHGIKVNRGYLWIQSFQRKQRLALRTANALAELLMGEGIFSFDNATGRSQLLAVKGEFKFAHFLDSGRYEILQPGEFSMIDADNGTPRRATPIGFQSYEKIIALFRKPTSDKMMPKRLPASFVGGKLTSQQVGDISSDLKNLYAGQMKAKKKKNRKKKTNQTVISKTNNSNIHKEKNEDAKVITRIFGLKKLKRPQLLPRTLLEELPQERPLFQAGPEQSPLITGTQSFRAQIRAPASQEIGRQASSPSYPWGFEGALRRHLRKTARHKLEEEGLVEELKDYREDYKITY